MTKRQERPNPEHKQRIGLREFLRGGYHNIKEPVLVMNRRKAVALWTPVETSEVPSPTSSTER